MKTKEELCKKIREKRTLLLRAKRFNNQQIINEMLLDLTVLNSRLADLIMDELERKRYADTQDAVSSTVSPDVEISNNPALYFGCPDGYTTGD